MKIFKQILNWINYVIDTYRLSYTKIKVERFHFNEQERSIIVSYRIGNTRLMHSLCINKFQHKYFDNCLNFDQHRLTKFATLQNILDKTVKNELALETIRIIKDEIKNGKLF